MNAVNFISYPWTTIIIVLINIPVYPLIAKLFFGEQYEKFWENFRLWKQGDLVSLIKGEYVDDFWSEMKLIVFLIFLEGWPLSLSEMWVRLFYL